MTHSVMPKFNQYADFSVFAKYVSLENPSREDLSVKEFCIVRFNEIGLSFWKNPHFSKGLNKLGLRIPKNYPEFVGDKKIRLGDDLFYDVIKFAIRNNELDSLQELLPDKITDGGFNIFIPELNTYEHHKTVYRLSSLKVIIKFPSPPDGPPSLLDPGDNETANELFLSKL